MRFSFSIALVALCAAALVVVGAHPQDPAAERLRIGTYDSRSIAIAFAASDFNPVDQKMAEMQEAKAAGDQQQVRKLEQWGRDMQVQLHFQGFGNVDVSDLLAPVKAEVAEVAARNGLLAIVDGCDFAARNVEVVDVTEELVKLYKPSEKTLKQALEVRKHDRVPLHTIAKMDPLD